MFSQSYPFLYSLSLSMAVGSTYTFTLPEFCAQVLFIITATRVLELGIAWRCGRCGWVVVIQSRVDQFSELRLLWLLWSMSRRIAVQPNDRSQLFFIKYLRNGSGFPTQPAYFANDKLVRFLDIILFKGQVKTIIWLVHRAYWWWWLSGTPQVQMFRIVPLIPDYPTTKP